MIPYSRPAATAHSPNRKERDPNKRWRTNFRINAIETKKTLLVNNLAIGMTREQAAIAAGMSPEGSKKLLKTHPGLEKRAEKAEADWAEQVKIAKGEIASRIVRITQRVGDTVLNTQDEKLILSGGLPIMRGTGVLPAEGVNVAVTNTNITLEVVYVDRDKNKNPSGTPNPALPSG